MDHISAVRAYKTGHSGINVHTVHYKIMVSFRDMPALKILETLSREKAIKQVRNYKTKS